MCFGNKLVISIHAPREGGDLVRITSLIFRTLISIHAPREGGDHGGREYVRQAGISIHAPREGGDSVCCLLRRNEKRFQSTPPARGATVYMVYLVYLILISIHAPREGGDPDDVLAADHRLISIHAPREGGDVFIVVDILSGLLFQSTPPARGATKLLFTRSKGIFISIHAPREGGD